MFAQSGMTHNITKVQGVLFSAINYYTNMNGIIFCIYLCKQLSLLTASALILNNAINTQWGVRTIKIIKI